MKKRGAYIHLFASWPQFHWDQALILSLLADVRNLQGKLIGTMEAMGFRMRNEAVLRSMSLDVLKSSEIEGEILNPDQVRSSIARRLGMDIAASVPSDRNVDGVVEMMVDATVRLDQPITSRRLFDWHSALFPSGLSNSYKILVGGWRDDSTGPMQVVSGGMGIEKVHFQAPDASRVEFEMDKFLTWLNHDDDLDLVIKAGIAHFWFLTIHPFEDGNGRIARAIADHLLAKSDGSSQRFYSMSAQIRVERSSYYEVLERSQKGSLDLTVWLRWFLECLHEALVATEGTLGLVTQKHRFWDHHEGTDLNERQRRMVAKMLEDFEGKLTSSKWAKIAKCSQDTAARDINDLILKGILQKDAAGGRSTHYELIFTA